MQCPVRTKCVTQAPNLATGNLTLKQSSDWITITDITYSNKQYVAYDVPPNTRCQFFILNSLLDEEGLISFKVLQNPERSTNTTSNASIGNLTLVRTLKGYLGNPVDETYTLP